MLDPGLVDCFLDKYWLDRSFLCGPNHPTWILKLSSQLIVRFFYLMVWNLRVEWRQRCHFDCCDWHEALHLMLSSSSRSAAGASPSGSSFSWPSDIWFRETVDYRTFCHFIPRGRLSVIPDWFHATHLGDMLDPGIARCVLSTWLSDPPSMFTPMSLYIFSGWHVGSRIDHLIIKPGVLMGLDKVFIRIS